jgi:hypothetical protein
LPHPRRQGYHELSSLVWGGSTGRAGRATAVGPWSWAQDHILISRLIVVINKINKPVNQPKRPR